MTTGRINQVAIPLSPPHARGDAAATSAQTQGRARVLTLKRLGTGGAKRKHPSSSMDLSHRTVPPSISRHQRRWI